MQLQKEHLQGLDELAASCPEFVDLTNSEHLEMVKEKAGQLLSKHSDPQELNALEEELIRRDDKALIFPSLVVKAARSKSIVSSIQEKARVSVVFAMYKEHNRIKKSSEHPHGEDFLRRKVAQLEWLFGQYPNFEWELIAVDDGCPEGSGRIAQDIIEQEGLQDKVRVLFLQDAIEQKLPTTEALSSTRDSQKGGAIVYGMWAAAQQNGAGNHIIAYTDADLSTHLGQLGLLIEPMIKQNKKVVAGSRRARNAVVIKKGSRNDRGKLFIYLWKRLITNLPDIIDTQCGFKAFRREEVLRITEGMLEKKFAFDIELLLKAALNGQDAITKVGIAWIDSEEASTTTDLQPYLPMLKSISKMYETYLPQNSASDQFAKFINALSEKEFNELVRNVPAAILSREPVEYTSFDEVSVEELELSYTG